MRLRSQGRIFSSPSWLATEAPKQSEKGTIKAIEQLQAARDEWSRKRAKRLDWINEEMRRQGHAVRIFHDVDKAMRQYSLLVGSGSRMSPLGPEPMLSDIYEPSPEQRDREMAFVVLGLGATVAAAHFMMN